MTLWKLPMKFSIPNPPSPETRGSNIGSLVGYVSFHSFLLAHTNIYIWKDSNYFLIHFYTEIAYFTLCFVTCFFHFHFGTYLKLYCEINLPWFYSSLALNNTIAFLNQSIFLFHLHKIPPLSHIYMYWYIYISLDY